MMKEYIYNNKISLIIDEDGDSFESFQKSLAFISDEIKPNEYKFENPFWNGSQGYFIKDNITIYLEYSNWTGTVLRVKENISNEDLQKVRQWALEIYNEVHKIN